MNPSCNLLVNSVPQEIILFVITLPSTIIHSKGIDILFSSTDCLSTGKNSNMTKNSLISTNAAAALVERSLSTFEIVGSRPAVGKKKIGILL